MVLPPTVSSFVFRVARNTTGNSPPTRRWMSSAFHPCLNVPDWMYLMRRKRPPIKAPAPRTYRESTKFEHVGL